VSEDLSHPFEIAATLLTVLELFFVGMKEVSRIALK
jgi:hypothetical protein